MTDYDDYIDHSTVGEVTKGLHDHRIAEGKPSEWDAKQSKITAGNGLTMAGTTLSETVPVTLDSSLYSDEDINQVVFSADEITVTDGDGADYCLLAGKQDKLTAGDGISISGNTISVSYPDADSTSY